MTYGRKREEGGKKERGRKKESLLGGESDLVTDKKAIRSRKGKKRYLVWMEVKFAHLPTKEEMS